MSLFLGFMVHLQELLCAVHRKPQSGSCTELANSRDQTDFAFPLGQAELKFENGDIGIEFHEVP